MNILIINVALRENSPVKMFPVGLGYITTAIKNVGFEYDLIDIDAHRYTEEEIKKLFLKKEYDIVCLGCIVTGYSIIKKISSIIKQLHPKCTIIVGNSVATSIPEILLRNTNVDIAVIGEGDVTIIDLLKTMESESPLEAVKGICFLHNGNLIKTPARIPIKDISSLPFIDYSLWDVNIYISNSPKYVKEPLPISREDVRILPVNTARGCISKCNFCYHVFVENPYRYRSAESIVGEIKLLKSEYSINYVHFWDELTFFSKKQIIKFIDKMKEEQLKFYWIGNCRADLFLEESDIDILLLMKESGCVGMGYALESADPSILRAMNKKISVDQFSKQTRMFHKVGIPVWTSIVLGYPEETPETIRKTFNCCIENSLYPSAGYLLPQPGSGMYEYAKSNGFIKDEEEYLLSMGDRQDLRLNMTSMTNEEFEYSVMQGLKRCNDTLKVGLTNENLVKTQYHRSGKLIDSLNSTDFNDELK